MARTLNFRRCRAGGLRLFNADSNPADYEPIIDDDLPSMKLEKPSLWNKVRADETSPAIAKVQHMEHGMLPRNTSHRAGVAASRLYWRRNSPALIPLSKLWEGYLGHLCLTDSLPPAILDTRNAECHQDHQRQVQGAELGDGAPGSHGGSQVDDE